MPSSPRSPETVDVAIVGGGISGLYAAWRLLKADSRRSVVVFELNDVRVGGRLDSAVPEGQPEVVVERGAMRVGPKQELVVGLVQELGLELIDFQANSLQRLRLRGESCDVELVEGKGPPPPYRLRPSEEGLGPYGLIGMFIQTIAGADAFDISEAELEARLQTIVVQGRRLDEWGLANLAYTVLSEEAWQYIIDTVGVESVVSNWNAHRAIDLLVYLLKMVGGQDDLQYKRVTGGWSQVPMKLASEIEAMGGQIRLDHRLRRIDPSAGASTLLHFTRGPKSTETPDDAPAAPYRPVQAEHLVLAMPRRSIELLDPESLVFDSDVVRDLLQLVVPQPVVRLLFGYRDPWWTTEDFDTGYALTTLPLRQVYYWSVTPPSATDPDAPRAMLMTSYVDAAATDFWLPLEQSEGWVPDVHGADLPTHDPDGDGPLEAVSVLGNDIPRGMVESAQALLCTLHERDSIPAPYLANRIDWGKDPYGGGWHLWMPCTDSSAAMKAIRKPLADRNLYVTGEAWSDIQGWVEGALRTAEHVLEDHLGLPLPTWVPPDTYLGP